MLSRRSFGKSAAAALISSAVTRKAPAIYVPKNLTLRVLGTDVTMLEAIRRQAESDLGFKISFEAKGSAGVLQKASTRPGSFDVYEQWSNSIKVLWNANAIQPIDTSRIRRWPELVPLAKTGKLTPSMSIGAGDAPHKLLYIQNDRSLGECDTGLISFVPYVHNVDSFGYNTSLIPAGVPYETESWAWLLDSKYSGKVGLVNEPAIGIFDMALAAKAQGLVKIQDIGNLTRQEIDALFEVLIRFKRQGHFSGIWTTVPQSVKYMQNGRVAIESMFSPAVSELNGHGIPVTYAAPKEGYRAWHGVLCVSSKASEYVLDAAYDYMNWWLEGWAGAHMARQGYYISVPGQAREHLQESEWEYWYAGKPAASDLPGADGRIAVKSGEIRRGGSYEQRFSNIAVWNTVMDTYEYSLVRWYELLTA